MAAFPEILDNWIQQNNVLYDGIKDLHTYLRQVATNPVFELAKKQIQDKLSTTLLGYEDARVRAREQVLGTVSDEGNALANFGQRIALLKNSFALRLRIDQCAKCEQCRHRMAGCELLLESFYSSSSDATVTSILSLSRASIA